MDRIDALRVFARVAAAESFRKAADQLDLPAATVSKAVQQIEVQVGTRLLQRTTRSVRLTPDGEAFLERCQQILADVDEAEAMFRSGRGQVDGKLRVDVPSRFARRVIAPALPTLFARYPDLALELGATDRSIDLVSEGVDCVVRVGQLSDSSLVARPLGRFEMINCASPSYLAAHGEPGSIDDLSAHLAVNYASPTSGKLTDWEWLDPSGQVRSTRMRSLVTVNSAEAYVACCLAGLGLIQVPACDVRPHLASGALVPVLSQARAQAMPVVLLYSHRRHLSRRVLAFAEWLESVFARWIEASVDPAAVPD